MFYRISDALTADDDRQVTLITLVDLPSAFDCVDHELLLRRLQYNFDFTDDVLRWITSFVSDRTQQVSYDGQLSPIRPVQFRVPHGSVLGPLLFVLYTADLNKIIASHCLQLHQYADDCQVCATTSVDDVEQLELARSPGRMCCRRRCMDELKPATSQLVQDAGDVAGTQEPDR